MGYGCTYTTGDGEWLATFPLGYADGYWRHLSNNGFIVRDITDEEKNSIAMIHIARTKR